MSTVRFADAVDALVAALRAAPALAGVPVYDGTAVSAAADPEFVIVGHDGTTEGGTGRLTATALAGIYNNRAADTTTGSEQDGAVNCLAVAQSGDTGDMAGRRARAQALCAAVEDAAAVSDGALAAGLTFDGVTDGRFVYRQAGDGLAVLHAFRLSYTTGYS